MPRKDATATLRQALQTALGCSLEPAPSAHVAGGSIAECVRWSGDDGDLFVKLAPAERRQAFEAEAAGLARTRRRRCDRASQRCSGTGTAGATAWLALRWMDFATSGRRSEALLGEQLASLHRVGAARFGWHRDNTIGATPQRNAMGRRLGHASSSGHRLTMQLDLAETSGASVRLLDRGRRLCEIAGALFSSYGPVPSLLHGDLWGGNWATDVSGDPVVFDPAVYFGDREADLAMTRLFGGFGPAFYAAYQSAWPLDPAAGTRRTFYNLYHVLNHFNLFGGGYAAQAEAMIERLLGELGH